MKTKYALLLPALLLAACAKKEPAPAPAPEATPAPAAAPAAPAPAPAPAPAAATGAATATAANGPLQIPQLNTDNMSDEQKHAFTYAEAPRILVPRRPFYFAGGQSPAGASDCPKIR